MGSASKACAIREAAAVGRELGLPSTDFDELLHPGGLRPGTSRRAAVARMGGVSADARGVACDAKLDRYACVDGAGNVSVRRIADDAEIARTTAFPGENFLSMSPDGQFLAAQCRESFRVWRLDRSPPSLLVEDVHVLSNGFSPDNRLLVQHSDGSIQVRDLIAGGPSREIAKVTGTSSTAIAVNPGGGWFALSTGRGVQVRDLATGAILSLLAPKENVNGGNSIAWHPSGDVIAFVDQELKVHVWDVRANRALAVLGGFTNGGIVPAFTAGGDILVTSGWEKMLRFWDWRSGKQVLSVPGASVVPPCYCERLLVYRTEGPTHAAVWEVDAAPEYRTLTVAPRPSSTSICGKRPCTRAAVSSPWPHRRASSSGTWIAAQS